MSGEIEAPMQPREVSRRWSTPAMALGVAFVATLTVAWLQSAKPFYDDSGGYWNLGEIFVKHGDFSLLNFDNPLRGYLLPLIDHGLHAVSVALAWSPSAIAKLVNALAFALIGTVLAPALAEIAWPKRHWNVARRLTLTALLIVFWSGYLNYPLSDFPALVMALLALVSLARADSPGWMLLAGFAVGAAIDMRPSYILLVPIALALVLWTWIEQRARGRKLMLRRALCLGLLFTGFLLVSLPQSLVSHRYFDTWSFVPGSAVHLESLQLTEGLQLQRYETFVGLGHGPKMLYKDEAGLRLLSKQPGAVVTSVGPYLGLIVSHPFTMAGLFARHIINGLDQRYSTPYVEHLDTGSHRWLRLAGFLLVFLALLRVLWPTARRRLGPAKWRYPAALLICCITSVPSAMETRYLLPVYLLGYMLVLAAGWPNPFAAGQTRLHRYRTPGVILVAYLLFMVVVWHVASSASAQLTFG